LKVLVQITRDLTYVKDTAQAFVEILKADHLLGEIANVGMKEEISIIDLVRLISDLLDADIEIISEEERIRPEKSEVERLVCDNTKIFQKTSWRPSYSLEKGLRETIDWLNQNIQLYKPEIYNV